MNVQFHNCGLLFQPIFQRYHGIHHARGGFRHAGYGTFMIGFVVGRWWSTSSILDINIILVIVVVVGTLTCQKLTSYHALLL